METKKLFFDMPNRQETLKFKALQKVSDCLYWLFTQVNNHMGNIPQYK